MNKKKAKSNLIEAKELLDKGLISQEQYADIQQSCLIAMGLQSSSAKRRKWLMGILLLSLSGYVGFDKYQQSNEQSQVRKNIHKGQSTPATIVKTKKSIQTNKDTITKNQTLISDSKKIDRKTAREVRRNYLTDAGLLKNKGSTVVWNFPVGVKLRHIDISGMKYSMDYSRGMYINKMNYYLVYCLSAMVYGPNSNTTESEMERLSEIFKFGWRKDYERKFDYTGQEGVPGCISRSLLEISEIEKALQLITNWAKENSLGPYKDSNIPTYNTGTIREWMESIPDEYSGFRTSFYWAGISNLLREILLNRGVDEEYSTSRTTFGTVF